MLLAQGRFWQASHARGTDVVVFETLKGLPDEMSDLREFRIEVPLAKWNLVIKHVHSDRKLLGGLLLDFAKHKDRVSTAVANDRLFAEFQRVVADATLALVEAGILLLSTAEPAES
jgi:hypothetical protein